MSSQTSKAPSTHSTRTALPTLHFPAPVQGPDGQGAATRDWQHTHAVLDALAARDLHTPSALGLLGGAPGAGGVLLTVEAANSDEVVWWTEALPARGYSALLTVATPWLDRADTPRDAELGRLLGFGLVVASAGDGAALRGRPLGALREVLTTSRQRLHDACGYAVQALHMPADALGRSADALVLEEAHRAGFSLFLAHGLTGDPTMREDALGAHVSWRAVRGDEDPEELADWASHPSRRRRLRATARTLRAMLDDTLAT